MGSDGSKKKEVHQAWENVKEPKKVEEPKKEQIIDENPKQQEQFDELSDYSTQTMALKSKELMLKNEENAKLDMEIRKMLLTLEKDATFYSCTSLGYKHVNIDNLIPKIQIRMPQARE